MTIFEDAVKILEDGAKVPYSLLKHIPDLASGFRNLCDRFTVVEQSRVDDMHRMQELESLTKAEKDELTAVAKDRTDLQHQVAALSQRLDTIEKAAKVPAGTPAPTTPETPATSKTLAETLGFTHGNPTPPVIEPVHVSA